MNKEEILRKFGDFYEADENSFKMGIDHRITTQIALRFKKLNVLETCTGAGFSTISLARVANKVSTIEIDTKNHNKAKQNIKIAGLTEKVDFILGDASDENLITSIPHINSAFLDPDWNDKGPDHIYKFKNSNMKPPADQLFEKVLKTTPNIAMILPPFIKEQEFIELPQYELQRIYINDEIALLCLYFGSLIKSNGGSEIYIEN